MAPKFLQAVALALYASIVLAAPIFSRTAVSGVQITYNGTLATEFCCYNNGMSGAQWSAATVCKTFNASETAFIPLPTTFKGMCQAGKGIGATMAEFQLKAADGLAWGDISLQQGCDRAATIQTMDGTNNVAGFTKNVLEDAPTAAFYTTGAVSRVALATTMGSWISPANPAAIDYLNEAVGQYNAYITGGSGTKVVMDKTNRLAITFGPGASG